MKYMNMKGFFVGTVALGAFLHVGSAYGGTDDSAVNHFRGWRGLTVGTSAAADFKRQ